MPRKEPKPFWKATHKCWYMQRGPMQIRLNPDEAKAWEMYYKIMAGSLPVGEGARVDELVYQFSLWSTANHKPGTRQFYRLYCESFLRFLPSGLRLRELKPYHLTKWVDHHWPLQPVTDPTGKVTPRASNNTRRGAMRAIQRVLNWARKQQLITLNPFADIEKPKATPREVYLWPEQYTRMLALIHEKCFRDVVETLRHTGCRPEEVRRVEARWVNMADQCWEFPRLESKGQRRQRVVLLNPVAWEITQRLCAAHPTGPIFRNRRDQPWKKKALVDRCRRLRPKAGFYITPYSIRHTFATDAILRGVDLATIAELMGHTDVRMLTEIYQHVRKRRDHLRAGLITATEQLNAPTLALSLPPASGAACE
ncbi:MAG: tyrosine-type recombinase/integrase [Candidatus Cryosericum sp.]